MFILSYLCSVLFSYLYQLSSINKLSFSYFKLRSKCDNCHQPLKWFELLPIISFICLKGRSNCCGYQLNKNYFIGELLAFLIIPFSSYFIPNLYFPLFLTTYLFLLTMSFYDIDTKTINVNLIVVLFIISFFIAHIYIFTFLFSFQYYMLVLLLYLSKLVMEIFFYLVCYHYFIHTISSAFFFFFL